MFIVALFITAPKEERIQTFINWWMHKMWYNQVIKCHKKEGEEEGEKGGGRGKKEKTAKEEKAEEEGKERK